MINRDIFSKVLIENQRLMAGVHRAVWLDVTLAAWNDYAGKVKQAWNRFPPKPTPCGTKMEFSQEYEVAVATAMLKKNARIFALYKQHIEAQS